MHTSTDQALELPFPTSRIIVFSDFNCPYCFTLNEWIYTLGASDRVRWVGIEHKPSLPIDEDNTQQDEEILAREVDDVQQRAPEVRVIKPRRWLNSHYALLYQNAIEDDEPTHAPRLRRAIFRAYWHEGREIAIEETIQHILRDHSLALPELEPEYLDELSAWWSQHLDRIPCMISPTGVVHYGLQDKISVGAYLNSALHETSAGPGCR